MRSEGDPELQADRLLELVPDVPGQVLLCPLLNAPGVTLGSAIWRRPHLESAIRALAGIGEVRLSPIGGTVGPGGDSWLSLLFVAHLPEQFPGPLDQLMAGFMAFLGQRLAPWEVALERGRVAGAWCPGFSDVSVGGRKLAGLGFKLTREAALIRAIIGVRPPGPTELATLDAAHRTFGEGVAPERLGWLCQILGMPELDREGALRLLVDPGAAPPGRISW